jgi:hypothetical protein
MGGSTYAREQWRALNRLGRRRRARLVFVALAAIVGSVVIGTGTAEAASSGASPIGFVDTVTSPEAGRIAVGGWAFDRDGLGMPVSIHVYVGAPAGERAAEGHDLGGADRHRPDVSARYAGVGADHGFDDEFTTGKIGVQMVYVYAVNLPGTPGNSVLLDARPVTVADPSPRGYVDGTDSPEAARIRVHGWVFDRNAVGSPVGVTVYVGGPATAPAAERHDLGPANRSRPDVAAVFAGVGANHGFDATFTTDKTGQQTVYVYGVNLAGTPGSDVLLGSQAVTIKAPDDLFTPITPTRIVDSRPFGPTVGPYATPWGTGTTRDVVVAGVAGVPADATAVVLNATVNGTSTASHLTIWPEGEARPTASNLNWSHDWTVANAVTVKVGAAGKVSVYNAQGSAHVVLDVIGYFRTGTGASFTALSPTRVVDSRANGPNVGPYRTPWGRGTTRDVHLGGVARIPTDARAVVLNATGTNTTGQSFMTVWPAGRPRPLASSLNWSPGWTIANAVTVELGTGGAVSVYSDAGQVDVVFDVVGYFAAGSGHAFHPISPARVQDSRSGGPVVGPYDTPWLGGVARDVVVTTGMVPSYASAVVLNVTAANTTAGSHLTVWPAGTTRPLASSLNWLPGWTIANAVTMPVGAGGKVSVYDNAGAVDVIADIGGWYG